MDNRIYKAYKKMKLKKSIVSMGDDLILGISILVALAMTSYSMHSYLLKMHASVDETHAEKRGAGIKVDLMRDVLLVEKIDGISEVLEVEIDGERFLIKCGIKNDVEFFEGLDGIKKLNHVRGISVEEIDAVKGDETVTISIDSRL